MSHISGLVAAGIPPSNPFDFCDIITSTVHKTLRGPRSALVFFRKSSPFDKDLSKKMLDSVFPGNLGGPHNHSITAMATALREANSEDFKKYQHQVVKNSITMGEVLKEKGYRIMTNGTDNHMILLSLQNKGVFGDEVYNLLDKGDVTSNQYTVKGTCHTARPNGLRVGSPAMTTRGCKESDFMVIGNILDEFVRLAKDIRGEGEGLMEFKGRMSREDNQKEIEKLKLKVNQFCKKLDYNYTREMI
jgi:glycine hydroxymethyltransferase